MGFLAVKKLDGCCILIADWKLKTTLALQVFHPQAEIINQQCPPISVVPAFR
jgi:hypothetical protein